VEKKNRKRRNTKEMNILRNLTHDRKFILFRLKYSDLNTAK